jgi:AcrR family transcriptional regulator
MASRRTDGADSDPGGPAVPETELSRSWIINARRPPTRRGQRTRSKVLDAAGTLFRARYYAEVTLADIAELSGMSVGTVYGYFESKEDVFLELLSHALVDMYGEARSGWQAGANYHDKIRSTTLSYVRAYYRNRHVMRSAHYLAATNEAAKDLLWSWRRDLEAQMAARLVQDQRASPIEPLAPAVLIRVLQSMVDEYVRRTYADEEFGPTDEQGLEQSAEVLADVWFRSIFGSEATTPPRPAKRRAAVRSARE